MRNIDEKLSKELKIALDNRAFEIQLFWQRSNYFLVLMSALGVAAFAIEEPIFSLMVSLLAVIASFLWFRTNQGSKFWQERWEIEVKSLSKEIGIRSFGRSISDIKVQVAQSLYPGGVIKVNSFRTWILKGVLEKPSVTYHMIILSFASTVVWAVVFGLSFLMIVGVIPSGSAGAGSAAGEIGQHSFEFQAPPTSEGVSPASPPLAAVANDAAAPAPLSPEPPRGPQKR